jgi:uncharacterized membrane protein YuzA (DUF378 family)
MLIGFWVAGQVSSHYVVGEGHNWKQIWMVPAGIAAVVMILFMLFFKENELVEPQILETPKLAIN